MFPLLRKPEIYFMSGAIVLSFIGFMFGLILIVGLFV